MRLPRLIIVTDWSMPRTELFDKLGRALAVGPEVAVQHRHTGAPVRTFLDEAKALRDLCARHSNPLFINGRLDVALLVGAHLHLPQSNLLPAEVRPHVPKGSWISFAVHDAAEAMLAQGADLALISPVYAPGSKPDDTRTTLGPEGFLALAQRLPCPAFALGGINAGKAALLRGAAGVAVINSVLRAPEPAAATREILEALGRPPEP